jgi:hypothetical protein
MLTEHIVVQALRCSVDAPNAGSRLWNLKSRSNATRLRETHSCYPADIAGAEE